MKSPELASPPEAFRDPKVAFRDLKEEFRDERNPSGGGATHSDVQTAAQVSPASNVSFKAQEHATNLQQKGRVCVGEPRRKWLKQPLVPEQARRQYNCNIELKHVYNSSASALMKKDATGPDCITVASPPYIRQQIRTMHFILGLVNDMEINPILGRI